MRPMPCSVQSWISVSRPSLMALVILGAVACSIDSRDLTTAVRDAGTPDVSSSDARWSPDARSEEHVVDGGGVSVSVSESSSGAADDEGGADASLPPRAPDITACRDKDVRICGCGAMSGGSQTCSGGHWGACALPCSAEGLVGKCATGTEPCDEARAQWGACTVVPSAADTCVADADDNCNGVKNEGCACVTGQSQSCDKGGLFGKCAAGTQACSAAGTWSACSIQPASTDTCAPGNDDNCNGKVNEGCPCVQAATRPCKDGGLMGKCAAGTQTCSQSMWSSCSIAPSVSDTCAAGNDDDCNGITNEGCQCIADQTRSCAAGGLFGKCAAGMQTCGATGKWGACSIAAAAADTCALGNDDSCNGKSNEGCACIGGQTRLCAEGGSKGNCASGTQTCDGAGKWGACSIAAAVGDTCSAGDDSSCNGVTNEGCGCLTGQTQLCSKSGLLGKCASGTQACAAGKWGACSITPSAADTCAAGNDDNCNGKTNEDCPCINDATRLCSAGGLSGKCAGGKQICAAGKWGACSISPSAGDTCEPGNNDNCNATANDGCTCVHGATRSCAQDGLSGPCALGTETCTTAGKWGACSIAPKAADSCANAKNDDNCNGVAFEGCSCVNGTTQACGACDNTQTCSAGQWSGCASCCPSAVSDKWSNYDLTYSSSPWKIVWPPETSGVAAPYTETASGGAVVFPRDSVIRREALSGGYVVSFSVAITTDMAVHLDFGGPAGVPYPAWRRKSVGGSARPITLGGLKYGDFESWSDFGSWSGQSTSSGSTRATIYIKASALEIAAAVDSPVVRSGFVARPGMDPKTYFQLIGSDLPDYNGSLDLGRVSNIVGCAGLSDSQVAALYKNQKTY